MIPGILKLLLWIHLLELAAVWGSHDLTWEAQWNTVLVSARIAWWQVTVFHFRTSIWRLKRQLMKKHHFFLFFASQSLSKDSQTCWWKTLGGRLDKVVPLGKWSTRAVYHTCSFPVGQANFLLSWGWGITTKHKDYQCPIIKIILFPFFSHHVDWSKLGEYCNNCDRSWRLARTWVPHLKSVNWQEFGSSTWYPL